MLVCADHSGVDLDQPIDVTGRIGLGLDSEVGWDHSRIATRKTELVQGVGGDVVGVVGQAVTEKTILSATATSRPS
ncbi:hypothetical protein OHA88_03960 [Streptomyces sp. NBC_00353]|uniref:hypothetical protein n=1 Tax=Streptomyces sp. NBC_00353 TaxID=2975722 RepID=UPI002E25F41C